jgi:predicted dehydrogenase
MIRELKELIKNNFLGQIIHIDVQMPQESFLKVDKNNNPLKPQEWRLKDYEIPTIYLDLGTHLHDLISFLIGKKPIEVTALNKSYGYFDVVDDVRGVVNYEDGISANYWFSKSALGHTNGLKLHIYGKKGSAFWYQLEPEYLYLYDNKGNKSILERGSVNCLIANLDRYNRFKAGHPVGFIEAFANYYYDIADYLLKINNNEKGYVFGIDDAIEGLMLLEAMDRSSKKRDWENVIK